MVWPFEKVAVNLVFMVVSSGWLVIPQYRTMQTTSTPILNKKAPTVSGRG
jgi:hypothetical protein